MLRYDLAALVEFLAAELYGSHKPLVRYSTFSLVNVTSNIAHLSYGLAYPPHRSIYSYYPVSFTFAFTSRDTYDGTIRPKFRVGLTQYTTIWGHSLGTNSDFITINVPKSLMRDVNLLVPNLREMKWLYMAIGAWSKNFVKYTGFYNPNGGGKFRSDAIDAHMAYSRYYQANVQQAFKRLSYDLWAYSRDIWDLCPNFVSPRSANEDFVDYYCAYLGRDFYGKYITRSVKEIESRVEEYVRGGVLDAMTVVNSYANSEGLIGDSSRAFRRVLDMLGGTLEPLQHPSINVDQVTRSLLSGTFGKLD